MKSVVYVEWVPVGKLMKALMGFFSFLILCILLVTITVGVAVKHPFLIAILAPVLAFLLLLFWNYRGIRIWLNREKLLVSYGVFNHKAIPIINIESCRTVKASFWRYGGVGVRLGTDGSCAYTTSFGDAVKVIRKKGKPFVFSSSNPHKICEIISQMKRTTNHIA